MERGLPQFIAISWARADRSPPLLVMPSRLIVVSRRGSDFFVMHPPRVWRLAERRLAAGLRVWFDEWVIQPGERFEVMSVRRWREKMLGG